MTAADHAPAEAPAPVEIPIPARLSADLAATTRPVDSVISPHERMPAEDLPGYLAVGESALKAIRLAVTAARRSDPQAILDLPCGHGRVLRWLAAAFPTARLTACDLIADGVDFCADAFGARPVYSVPAPGPELFGERYDLIWVGSLLTHVGAHAWDTFIALFADLLAPEGVLVVTTHGELVAARMRAGNDYGYGQDAIARSLGVFDEGGFAYIPSPGDPSYGISIARPEWTVRRLLRQPSLRLALYTEALWANHQDVVAVVKRPTEPRIAERPYT